MSIDAKTVAELRKRTGLPMMKCKQALADAGGDLTQAEENLRKEGHKTIDKLKGREMKDGLVFTHESKGAVAAVAVLCETDFVARSADFVAFGEMLARDLLDRAPADEGEGDALASLKLSDGRTVQEHLDELVGSKIRENMRIGDFARFRPEQGCVVTYVHHNRRVACMVELGGAALDGNEAAQELGRDLGMQIAFHAQVRALTKDGLDPAWVEKEREIFVAQVQDMPEPKRKPIAEGKLAKRLKEVVLLDMPFVRNEKETVQQHVEAVAREAGTPITVRRFARIAAGA